MRRLFIPLMLLLLAPVVAVLALRWVDPPISAVMLQHRFALWRDDAPQQRLMHHWVDLRDQGHQLPLAVVAAEDQRFPMHFGFDVGAIQRALDHNERGGRLLGASTLSQQVAKNLFLWQSRSWLRKGLEAGFTVLIEVLWPKQRILEMYLNIAEWGPNLYGADAAARYWFGKPPSQLSRREAAQLAVILPNPKRLRAHPASDYVSERADWVAQQMQQLGDDWLGGILPSR